MLSLFELTAHFAWEVQFAPRDVNLTTVRANLNAQGQLTLHVGRCGTRDATAPVVRPVNQ